MPGQKAFKVDQALLPKNYPRMNIVSHDSRETVSECDCLSLS